jgi:hypothetical protein
LSTSLALADTDLRPSDLYGGVESLEFKVIVDSEAAGPDRKAQLERLSIRRYMQECLTASAYQRLHLPAMAGEVPRPDIMPVMAHKGPGNFTSILTLLLRLRIADSPIANTSSSLTIVTYDVEMIRNRSDGWALLAYQQPIAFVAADLEQAVLAQFDRMCEDVAREPATRLRSIGR